MACKLYSPSKLQCPLQWWPEEEVVAAVGVGKENVWAKTGFAVCSPYRNEP